MRAGPVMRWLHSSRDWASQSGSSVGRGRSRANDQQMGDYASKGEATKLMSYLVSFPGSTVVKNPPANAGHERDPGSVSGSGLRRDLGWEWERLEISSRTLEISREHFM